jgi:hypothetical protein
MGALEKFMELTRHKTIFLHNTDWDLFDEETRNLYVSAIIEHYRKVGYPHFETDRDSRDKRFKQLQRSDVSKLISTDEDGQFVIRQSMTGLGLAWSYFPHHYGVQCGNMRTPKEVFDDNVLLRKAVEKRLKTGTYMNDGGFRKGLKIYSGTQCVSNFRPTAAGAIYKYFLPHGGLTWDMSSGYGGRLLGAIIQGLDYIGTDPSDESMKGLKEIHEDYGNDRNISLYQCGSENFVPDEETIDLCFTSPPYFDWEKYSTDSSQSYVKFSTPEAWINGFLFPTFRNCYIGLKNSSPLVVNIASIKTFPTIVEETVKIAKKAGFTYDEKDSGKLALSSMIGTKKPGQKFKYEPILVFKK